MQSTDLDAPAFAEKWHRYWNFVLDVALTIWVLRAPITSLIAGYLLLWVTPQGQDLFVGLAMAGLKPWLRFLAIFLLVWAAPTEYAAHILLVTDHGYNRPVGGKRDRFRIWLKRWSPKILGALVFVCILGAIVRSSWNVPSLASDANYTAYIKEYVGYRMVALALVVCSFSVAFWCYTLAREDIAKLKIVRLAEKAAALVLRPLRTQLPPIFALRRGHDGSSEIESDLGPLLLILMFVLFAAWPTIDPLKFADRFPLAASVPFVIGGWIPLLAVLSGLGRRLHAPLLLLLFLPRTMLPLSLAPDYEIAAIDPQQTVAALPGKANWSASAFGAISLNQAIGWWKSANCESADQKCPRPIIVAAAGGASRAGFFTASVIGQLLDDELTGGAAHGHHLPPSQVMKRLFAFSTVSGSSVAAVMSVAAMAASGDGLPPCRYRSGGYWKDPEFQSNKIRYWRDCLENLLSGDFLTPVLTGLVFHDTVRFLRLHDRAWMLEESWRDQFSEVLDRDKPLKTDTFACVGSLACPFMTLRPTSEHWLPLLLLNGTSVATGQRIITTALDPTYERQPNVDCPTGPPRSSTGPPRPVCSLFLDAYRFHDLLNAGEPPNGSRGWCDNACDIDLAAAALNSARFPLVTPPGDIRDAGGRIVDSIVDGGYFENFGVQTATELAQAIMAADPALDPFVLVLSNNPEAVQQEIEVKERSVPVDNDSFVPDLSAPITAFANTRNARGALALDETGAVLRRPRPGSRHVAQIRVWGEAKGDSGAQDISMSWWLSEPLQLELHEQTEFDGQGRPAILSALPNCDAIRALLTALASPPSAGETGDQHPCLTVGVPPATP